MNSSLAIISNQFWVHCVRDASWRVNLPQKYRIIEATEIVSQNWFQGYHFGFIRPQNPLIVRVPAKDWSFFGSGFCKDNRRTVQIESCACNSHRKLGRFDHSRLVERSDKTSLMSSVQWRVTRCHRICTVVQPVTQQGKAITDWHACQRTANRIQQTLPRWQWETLRFDLL